uniref:Uncharacterized protein n=1 Tax=Amphimedon queenslandica TaxID=400682 RepID=A0A1X7TJT8_AMPQE
MYRDSSWIVLNDVVQPPFLQVAHNFRLFECFLTLKNVLILVECAAFSSPIKSESSEFCTLPRSNTF